MNVATLPRFKFRIEAKIPGRDGIGTWMVFGNPANIGQFLRETKNEGLTGIRLRTMIRNGSAYQTRYVKKVS